MPPSWLHFIISNQIAYIRFLSHSRNSLSYDLVSHSNQVQNSHQLYESLLGNTYILQFILNLTWGKRIRNKTMRCRWDDIRLSWNSSIDDVRVSKMMKAKIELEHELKLERRRSRWVNLERHLQELMTHLEGTFSWSHDVTYKKGRKKMGKEVYWWHFHVLLWASVKLTTTFHLKGEIIPCVINMMLIYHQTHPSHIHPSKFSII